MGCATAAAEKADCSDLAPAKTGASQLACLHVGAITRSERSALFRPRNNADSVRRCGWRVTPVLAGVAAPLPAPRGDAPCRYARALWAIDAVAGRYLNRCSGRALRPLAGGSASHTDFQRRCLRPRRSGTGSQSDAVSLWPPDLGV